MVLIDVEVEIDIERIVEQTLREMDVQDVIDIDYADIRYQIEDDILDQVMNHVDVDEIAECVQGRKEDLDDAIRGWIENGCADVDTTVDELLERGARFTELERTVKRLVEHMSLPEERTPMEQVMGLIESNALKLRDMEQYFVYRCDVLRNQMKKMNKHELIGTAQKMGYESVHEDMTMAQIREVVGI